jgi:hypothetical protein
MSDSKRVMTGTFGATGQSAAIELTGPFNVSVSGFGTATVALQRSFDNGITWLNVESYNSNTERVGDEPEAGVFYRFSCSAYTSGTLAYRLSQ